LVKNTYLYRFCSDEKVLKYKLYKDVVFVTLKGDQNHEMTPYHHKYDDGVVKPFTLLPDNPIRVADFLTYVASHQNAMEKYKEEFQVGRSFLATNQRL